jgi:hypothetical protein
LEAGGTRHGCPFPLLLAAGQPPLRHVGVGGSGLARLGTALERRHVRQLLDALQHLLAARLGDEAGADDGEEEEDGQEDEGAANGLQLPLQPVGDVRREGLLVAAVGVGDPAGRGVDDLVPGTSTVRRVHRLVLHTSDVRGAARDEGAAGSHTAQGWARERARSQTGARQGQQQSQP